MAPMDYDLTASYDYALPDELIADAPAPTRSASRLMVGAIDRQTIGHMRFDALPTLLRSGDLLVFNDTRVVAARLSGHKPTGGAVELFVIDVLSPSGPERWAQPAESLTLRCMTRSSKPVRAGQEIEILDHHFKVLTARAGVAEVSVDAAGRSAAELLAELGQIPLPPYIVRRRADLGKPAVHEALDAERYQTIYAATPGAVAAPTAGLHFDAPVFAALDARGIRRATLTLDVGPGTFRPVASESLAQHEMHTETYRVSPELGRTIAQTRAAGGRVVAVGTTCVRALEAEARAETPFSGDPRSTDIFIRPGFDFQLVDAMITNFHLPLSTLLALVYAFGGPAFVREMYEVAVAESYRFYSYGDAMLLWRQDE